MNIPKFGEKPEGWKARGNELVVEYTKILMGSKLMQTVMVLLIF
jgi:hypothetical protein